MNSPTVFSADERRTGGVSVGLMARAFRAGLYQPMANRSALIGYGFFFLLPPLVLAGVWKVAAESSGGNIVGYDATALVWYIVISETAILTVRNRLIEEIGEDIGSDRISVEMQRPVSVLPVRLAMELGYMAPRFGVGLSLALAVGLLMGGRPPSLVGLALAFPTLILALIINVVGQYLFATASFWMREAKGAWFLYNKLVFVLGGMLLPLEVLPQWMETVAKLLPFMAMAYVPARLAAGFVEPGLIAVQLIWLGLGLALVSAGFRRGERHLMMGRS